MKSYFLGLLYAAINASAKGAASATDAGADMKTVGIAAGATAAAGVLGYVLSHPAAQHPVIAPAVLAATQQAPAAMQATPAAVS